MSTDINQADCGIACKNHAHEFGVDPSDITNWQWPF